MLSDKFSRPFKDLRISVTDRCNFRCSYCMPAEMYGDRYKFIPKPEILTFEEITRLTRIFVGLGASKVRLTGGEPLVRSDIEILVSKLAKIPGILDLTMTTNGYLLSGKAQALKDAGLKRVTVSLDSLDDSVFREMNGRDLGVGRVLKGIEMAESVGLKDIKINTVVKRGVNDHTVVELAHYFKKSGHTVRFIEYMDVGTLNGWRMDEVVSADEIVSTIDAVMPLELVDSNYRGEVATRYRYRDGTGEIGVISSVTNPFCGDCTRLRLSPEGKLVTCLFGTVGTDLRSLLRNGSSDLDIEMLTTNRWLNRDDQYSEKRRLMTEPIKEKVEMYHIGG